MEKNLEKISKAVIYEQKQGYSNTKGIKFHFSEYISSELNNIINNEKLTLSQQLKLKKLNLAFLDYPELCIADRKEKINQLNHLFQYLKSPDNFIKEESRQNSAVRNINQGQFSWFFGAI